MWSRLSACEPCPDSSGHSSQEGRATGHSGRRWVAGRDLPRADPAGGAAAVLTYRFNSHGSEGSMRWNATEVYRNGLDGWKIIHTHWAFHQPKIAE